MGWIDGDNAYAIAIDNIDGNDGDLDFFDISDPANPVWLSETGIDDWPTAEVNAFGDFPTSHDFDVRDRWHLVRDGVVLGRRMGAPECRRPSQPDVHRGLRVQAVR